jgi:3-dehydroquinate synthase
MLKSDNPESFPSCLFAPDDRDAFNHYLVKKKLSGCRFFILVDKNTKKHCVDKLIHSFPVLENQNIIKVPAGEENKTLDTCVHIWETLAKEYAERNSMLINLGGGVITDIGGFTASVYKRGILHCNVPTSLLGMVDAAIGAKTGIDFAGLKNILGTFRHAGITYVDPAFLQTLGDDHMRSGFAELLKIALVADKELWLQLQNLHYKDIPGNTDIIAEAVKLKEKIVDKDLLEHGLRKILNFGHTIGHAVESFSIEHDKKPLLHGDAVAIGMICETWISNKVTGLPDAVMKQIIDKIVGVSGKFKLKIKGKEFMRMLHNDKKNAGSKIMFTLLKSIGEASFDNHFDDNLIFDSLKFYSNL